MFERRVKVGSSVGLHARPAAVFCAAASKRATKVTIGREDGPWVDARSIVMVMSLRIQGGEVVVVRTDEEAGEAAVEELAALVASELDSVA